MSSNPTSLFRDATRPPKHSVSIDAIRAVAPPAASRSSHSHTRSTSPKRNRSLSSERSGVRTSTPAARPRSTTMSIVTGRPSSGTKSRTGAAINRYSLTPSPHPLPLTGGEGKGEETTCERIHYLIAPAVRPRIKYRCVKRKTTITGSVAITVPAAIYRVLGEQPAQIQQTGGERVLVGRLEDDDRPQ